MSLNRREFIQLLSLAAVAGLSLTGRSSSSDPAQIYDFPPFGNVSLLHFTDCHAQLLPLYFREPSVNIGLGDAFGRVPHRVGRYFLDHFSIPQGSPEAYAYTCLDFESMARQFGKVGGFAHLATLIKRIRALRPHSLLLDGGDTLQGSATALWTQGRDMIGASQLLGVDIMTGHWEFTYGMDRVRAIIDGELDPIEFLAQNVVLTEDAAFDDKPAYDPESGQVFKPYTLRELNGVRVGIIGQAFPYTSLANPRYMVEDWSFGIRDNQCQSMVDVLRDQGAELVVVLSHNGMDVDLKMAQRVSGIDVILGGHTHDGVPVPEIVNSPSGRTLVVNSGSNGKFLSVMDLDVRHGHLVDYRFRMLPVFSNFLPADSEMAAYVDSVRAPFVDQLTQVIASTEVTLYRRGNFGGTFDQVILDAMLKVRGADIAFSPGFRWGTSLLPGDAITYEHVMDQTAITYAKSTLNEMTGEMIHQLLEGIADNLFNSDPYYQMGGDMVRVGGLTYTIDPAATIGRRISQLELAGTPLDAAKTYRVAGWASVNPQPDELPNIWDVLSEYLMDVRVIRNVALNLPRVKGVDQNPGMIEH
ncbi:MAG: thiosulfohydrolase SoxB [Arenicellales bacterium]|jgi:sulfur-oxidizing protein SoxB|nr:thiosulfohydrolase SoxB [Gammaproteobacteria bacterium]MDP7451590.1 thiosulfohydrolase SoxB [Arenicellales bacterium]MDP7516790.1 thiosulfohydrolase SoxB [Arenicellales bacterium]MDP7616331.1 thiosulfohydrolase SoxB [Arenicellales bacterium]HJL51958.1 thiosulfohydrolase SoxB [Arenicellales bacterium]|tara:strand:+ start:3156 stop:4907 length:1752 start_codon:yes stop_codon:yes gene_type:complete